MDRIERISNLNELFLTYQLLFTDKQREYFNYYYMLDYSYQEIAELFDVSRNAVFDALKKVEEQLIIYEEKLQVVSKRNKRLELIDKYLETKEDKYLLELQRMDQ